MENSNHDSATGADEGSSPPSGAAGKADGFLRMISHTGKPAKFISTLLGLGLLALVGCADYSTGYERTLLVFYLLPILLVLRYAGLEPAIGMAVLAAFTSLLVDIGAGHHYADRLTPVWNAAVDLVVFLLVTVLFYLWKNLQALVNRQTEHLRREIQERTRLEKELLEIAEAEQRRISHDLHDSLGQHLTATAMAGKILARRLNSHAPVDPATADQLVAMVEAAISLTRNLASSLHPISMEADGLKDALRNLAGSLSQAFNVSCEFQNDGNLVWSSRKADLQLYRIAQEAAGNAIRHGHARRVIISLEATSASLRLVVTDDGTGLASEARKPNGMGLRIMAYRAHLIGASFDVQNLPGGGARAVCLLKAPPKDHENP